jgi:hypothetical protein
MRVTLGTFNSIVFLFFFVFFNHFFVTPLLHGLLYITGTTNPVPVQQQQIVYVKQTNARAKMGTRQQVQRVQNTKSRSVPRAYQRISRKILCVTNALSVPPGTESSIDSNVCFYSFSLFVLTLVLFFSYLSVNTNVSTANTKINHVVSQHREIAKNVSRVDSPQKGQLVNVQNAPLANFPH